jgi:hypothetical protein
LVLLHSRWIILVASILISKFLLLFVYRVGVDLSPVNLDRSSKSLWIDLVSDKTNVHVLFFGCFKGIDLWFWSRIRGQFLFLLEFISYLNCNLWIIFFNIKKWIYYYFLYKKISIINLKVMHVIKKQLRISCATKIKYKATFLTN